MAAMATSTSPPPVEVLTRSLMSLFTKDGEQNPANEPLNGHAASEHTSPKPVEMTSQGEERSPSYKEFLSKLKSLSKDQPILVKQLSEFFNRILSKQLVETYPVFESEDIPGCHEELAPEVRAFIEQMSRELQRTLPWLNATEDEAMIMKEHLEKLVTSKCYERLFAPTDSHHDRDKQLRLKIKKLQRGLDPVKHLDLKPSLCPKDVEKYAWEKASEELRKMVSYKSPRDKLVCITNASRILVQFIKSKGENPIPDVFLPVFIYCLILSDPPQLHSSIEFISAYRGHDFLRGEPGHYLLHAASAVSFIWRSSAESLSMSPEEFEEIMSVDSMVREAKEDDFRLERNRAISGQAFDSAPGSQYSRDWFEERFKFENFPVSELRVSEVADLMEQYQLLVKACRDLANLN